MRDPPPGEGPSLVSGEAYQYQLRHIRQNLDPGDALAAERAVEALASIFVWEPQARPSAAALRQSAWLGGV